ncbi:MAG: hypothetical protein KKF77_01925 [Proteobacteria bacterium]|nr:hypothetical protein [Pseudomonadota bacterium]
MEKSTGTFKQTVVIVIQDILLLAILSYSIYEGHKDLDQFTGIFLRNFIPLALSTVLGAKLLIRKFRKTVEQDAPPSAA